MSDKINIEQMLDKCDENYQVERMSNGSEISFVPGNQYDSWKDNYHKITFKFDKDGDLEKVYIVNYRS